MGLLDSIIGAESGGNPNATNPNSSATGPAQFISSTWLDMMRRYRPDIQGSDSDLLAMRSDPALSREMAGNYAAQNQKTLADAGVPVTDGTTYLAHFAGPQGAVKVLQADPNASVSDILGSAVIKANPFLQGMTASDLQAWADRKMGVARPAQVASASPAMPPSATPLQIAPNAPPIFSKAAATPQPAQQQVEAAPSYWQQMPVDQMTAAQPPPLFNLTPPARRQIDISKLRMALGNRGLFFQGKA